MEQPSQSTPGAAEPSAGPALPSLPSAGEGVSYPAPKRFALAGHRVWVAPEYEAGLRAVLSERLLEPERVEGAQVIKHNRVRTVARMTLGPGVVFCKRFRVRRAFDRALHLIKPSPARREWEALLRLAAAGIDVPRPVLLAEQRAAGGCLLGSNLATVEVAGAEELTRTIDRLRAEGDAERRPRLLAGLASVLHAVFKSGCDHPDLHLANFLVRPNDRLVALDLHSVRLRASPVAPARRRLRLAKLAHSFGLYDPDTAEEGARELEWFVQAYLREDPSVGLGAPGPSAAAALVAHLRARAWRIERERLVSRDRRCLVNSTTFAVERRWGERVWRRQDVPRAALLTAVRAEPLSVVHEHPKGRSRIVTVARPAGFPGEGPLLVKHYLLPSLRRRLGDWLTGSLALRAWRAARACEVRHAPAPAHYGLLIEGVGVPARAAIVQELLADVTMIHVLLQADPLPAPAARRQLARDFGRVMGRFHGAGLRHNDLAVQNVLVRPRAGDGREGWEVFVIDLDEVRAAPMNAKQRMRALTQMGDLPEAATRTDRLRFWRAYLDAGARAVYAQELEQLGELGLGRALADALAARAEAKAKRMAKRGHQQPRPTNLAALERDGA